MVLQMAWRRLWSAGRARKARRKLHALPILSHLEELLGHVPAAERGARERCLAGFVTPEDAVAVLFEQPDRVGCGTG